MHVTEFDLYILFKCDPIQGRFAQFMPLLIECEMTTLIYNKDGQNGFGLDVLGKGRTVYPVHVGFCALNHQVEIQGGAVYQRTVTWRFPGELNDGIRCAQHHSLIWKRQSNSCAVEHSKPSFHAFEF